MSESDGSGELPLFRDAPPESRQVSIPSWRPSLADGWSSKAPSRRAVEAQGPDLLCRGLEFLEAVEGAVDRSGAGGPGGAGDALVQRFRERQEDLAQQLAEWPDVEAGNDEAADAARPVAATVDELAGLRRRILEELDAGARRRVLAAERRMSSEPRRVQRVRSLADFLLAEARGDVVGLHLSPSFLSQSAIPELPSTPGPSSPFLGPADVEALMGDHMESMKAEQEARPLPARGRLKTLLASIPVVWLDAVWTALDLGPDRPRHRKERERRIARHLTGGDTLGRIVVHALSPEERELLDYLLEEGGRTPVGKVTRRYGSDQGDGWFWDEDPPTSTLGRLRLHGLAFVGVDASSGRRMRTVLVPRDLRDALREALDEVPDAGGEDSRAGTGRSGRGSHAGTGASGRGTHDAPASGGPGPRFDVRRALEDAFPDGVIEPLWFEDAWLADAWEELEMALADLPRATLLHQRPPLEATDWSLVIYDEENDGEGDAGKGDDRDDDEESYARGEAAWDDEERAAWGATGWGDEERSYGIFFVGPEDDAFRFDFDSELPDEEGHLQPVKGVGRIGWAVAVSAVAPFALLRVRSLDVEGGMVLPPGIGERFFDNRGRPQSEALFLREMLDDRENGELDDLRERIVRALRERGVATLSEEELAVGAPWLTASEEVLVAKGPGDRVSVEDGLFFRYI